MALSREFVPWLSCQAMTEIGAKKHGTTLTGQVTAHGCSHCESLCHAYKLTMRGEIPELPTLTRYSSGSMLPPNTTAALPPSLRLMCACESIGAI
jgi:hypothetical protein